MVHPKKGEILSRSLKLSEHLKPDIPETDVVLDDEEGIANIDHTIPVDVDLPKFLGAGVRHLPGLYYPHNLLEHEEGVALVNPPVPISIPSEDWGDLDVAGFCADPPSPGRLTV